MTKKERSRKKRELLLDLDLAMDLAMDLAERLDSRESSHSFAATQSEEEHRAWLAWCSGESGKK